MRGFSPRNLKYMRAFAEAWPEEEFVRQAAAQIPWFHHCVLLDKVKSRSEREWYLRSTVQHGWSRNILVHQIESRLLERQGRAVTNFDGALPPPQSDLAQQITKDPTTSISSCSLRRRTNAIWSEGSWNICPNFSWNLALDSRL
jgi:predicted nuclease of restriction endonuclease-like (RecB) superfamily